MGSLQNRRLNEIMTMSARKKIKLQATRIAELEALLAAANLRIRQLSTVQCQAKEIDHAPVITLGSAFGGAQVKQVSLPMSAPCSPREELPITRANSEPQVQTPAETETLEEPAPKKRTLSVFTDENVKFKGKFKAGETLGVKAQTYKV